jgi:DNA invertase Pin-like site-specific DNA recombinase
MSNAGMRVGFARVSTDKREQDTSIDGQVEQLKGAGCDPVIVERASAFSGRRRPGWEELQALVASGQVAEVVVVDQSRLSRKGEDLDFLGVCALKGTIVRDIAGTVIESETIGGFLATGVVSLVNQAQSKIISIKVKDGIRRRRAAGHLGTGKLPFGYAHIDGKAAPDLQNWEAARAMFDQLVGNGMNISGWIRETGMPWTPPGIRRWIKNPMLRGCVQGQWGAVEPLISGQEYEQAERLLALRSTRRGTTANTIHLFSGLVKCELCNKSLHNVNDRGRARLVCKAAHCAYFGRGVRVSQVREQVIAALAHANELMADLAARHDMRETAAAMELRAQIAQLQQLQAQGVPGLEASIAQQKAQLSAMGKQTTGPRRDQLAELFSDPGVLELATDDELRPIVIEFVERIEYRGGPESLLITLR